MSLKSAIFDYLARIEASDQACINEHMEGHMMRVEGLKHEVTFGKHSVAVDEPLVFGGTESAANPAEVALAGVAASISVTLQALAAMEDIAIDDVRIVISGTLDARGFFDLEPGIRAGFRRIDIELRVDSPAPSSALSALLKRVERACPVLDAVRDPTPVRLTMHHQGDRG